jgi:hypothetical protein
MVYIFFSISFLLYFYFQALDKHLKYFHESKKDEKIFNVLKSPKRFVFFSNWRPNWILSHDGYFWYQRIIESLLYFLLPFLICTGFYSIVQYMINSHDNINEVTMSIEQLCSKYKFIKERIDPYLYLLKWLFPLSIILPILCVLFPFVFNYRFSNYVNKTRKLIFRIYYIVSVFSIFTFWSAQEVNRQNNVVASLASKIDKNSKEIRKLGNKAAQVYSEAIAQEVLKSKDLKEILNNIQNVEDQINSTRKLHYENKFKYSKIYNNFLIKLSTTPTFKFWSNFQGDLANISYCCPPFDPGPDPKGKELPIPYSKYTIIKDNRTEIEENYKHPPFEFNLEKNLNISEQKLSSIYNALDEIETQLVEENKKLNSTQKVLKNATLFVSNAILFNIFQTAKNSFETNPIMECLADAIFINTLPEYLSGFIITIFEGKVKTAKENVAKTRSMVLDNLNNTIFQSSIISNLRDELKEDSIKIELEKKIFDMDIDKRKNVDQMMASFSESEWEVLRNKFFDDFENYKFYPGFYAVFHEKRNKVISAINNWKHYRDNNSIEFLMKNEIVAHPEDIFWTYARKNIEIMSVFQLAIMDKGLPTRYNFKDFDVLKYDYSNFNQYLEQNNYKDEFNIIKEHFEIIHKANVCYCTPN